MLGKWRHDGSFKNCAVHRKNLDQQLEFPEGIARSNSPGKAHGSGVSYYCRSRPRTLCAQELAAEHAERCWPAST
jgi:hypothetical protein